MNFSINKIIDNNKKHNYKASKKLNTIAHKIIIINKKSNTKTKNEPNFTFDNSIDNNKIQKAK